MMERLLPQRFCPPSELGNPQKTRVSTFPQRRRLLLLNWTQLLNPRKSNVSTDSRPEPQKYWPKLVRSYATEAVVTRTKGGEASPKDAQKFLDNLQGRRETAETEPGIYRQTEITGDGFKVFELTSLLPKTGFAVHVTKMAD